MTDLRLPSQPQSVIAHWLTPNCTAWWGAKGCEHRALSRYAAVPWRSRTRAQTVVPLRHLIGVGINLEITENKELNRIIWREWDGMRVIVIFPPTAIMRPQQSLDAAYCYRRSSVVWVSVCWSRSWAVQNGWTDRDAVGGWLIHVGPRNRVLDGAWDPFIGRGNFWGCLPH